MGSGKKHYVLDTALQQYDFASHKFQDVNQG